MERSGNDAPGALRAPDLTALMTDGGPFITIWTGAGPGSRANPRTLVDAAIRDAAAPGSPPPVVIDALVKAVEAAMVPSGVAAPAGVVAVADMSEVRLVESLPQPPRADLARVGSLPSIAPVIEHRQGTVPFVTVVTDRVGADLVWSGSDDDGATTVSGDDDALTKVRKGGWSHRRMQQRAENTWENTANEVAATLVEIVGRVQPRVVTVAGDVRMVQFLRDRLPAGVAALIRDVPGGRSEDGSDQHRDDAIRRWVNTAVAEDTVALLQLFSQERGQQDRAADGQSSTMVALREARVDVLLVHDDPDDERLAWFVDSEPSLIADDPATLRQLGHEDPREGRLVDVAIRSALATGAGIRIVPGAGPVSEGIGAILRW
jgi:hypothetical protein